MAILASTSRLIELYEATERRLDALEVGSAVAKEQRVEARAQFVDIKARLDRPGGVERAFEAMAAGMGKLLDNKPAVVLAVLLLAGLAGVVIDTPWGKVGAGSGDDDTAAPLAQDDDDGDGPGGNYNRPSDPEDDGAVAGD
jgi:hypothetical protein